MDTNTQFTVNSFRQLFQDKIFSLTIPWFSVKSLTFPWQLSNSLTFPGFPDKWSPWPQYTIIMVLNTVKAYLWSFTSSFCGNTHSLTHCCAWPAEGRSVLHIERSWPAIQAAPTDRPTSSSTCCSQFLRGRPGGRFQSAAGGVPVWKQQYKNQAVKNSRK